MDYVYLYCCNFGCCWWWMIRLNVSNIYWITAACYEPKLLYGDTRVWLVTIVQHIVLNQFLYLLVAYIVLWSLVKNTLFNSLVLPFFCLCLHFGSGNAPIWYQYNILDCRGETNTSGLWVLHFQPYRFQGVKFY